MKFYFDTGVKPWNNGHVDNGVIGSNNTIVIPFECEDVPENAVFEFASIYDNLERPNLIKREILNSTLNSKYAYFRIYNAN